MKIPRTLRTVLTSFVLFSACAASFFAQQTASILPQRPKWQTVLEGDALCPPQMTSYGFAVLLDARVLCAVTENGTVYWSRSVPGRPEPYLTVTDDDFIYVISQKKKMTLFNPSGTVLWTVDCEQPVTAAPLIGRDRRVFAAGTSSLSCYGLDGRRKFYITTGENNSAYPLFTLPDGSILLIQQKEISGASTALRISPYGEILEEIVFTGRITAAAQSPQGAVLGFSDGTAGCCSVVSGTASTVWIIQSPQRNSSAYPVRAAYSPDENGPNDGGLQEGGANAAGKGILYILYRDSYLSIFSTSGRQPEPAKELFISDIKPDESSYFRAFRSTCTILDSSTAVSVRSSGVIDWKIMLGGGQNTASDAGGVLSAKTIYSYTTEGHLLVFPGDWTVQAYRVKQYLTAQKHTSDQHVSHNTQLYKQSYQKDPQPALSLESASSYYRKGNYGSIEQMCIEVLNSELLKLDEYYMNDRPDMMDLYYHLDAVSRNTAIYTAGLTGTSAYIPHIARIISRETDPSYLITALSAAEAAAYDPDQKLLESISSILRGTNMKNYQILTAACDAVYSICRYMGKPAIFTRGKEILSSLMYSYIDSGVRSYARKTMLAIAQLEK